MGKQSRTLTSKRCMCQQQTRSDFIAGNVLEAMRSGTWRIVLALLLAAGCSSRPGKIRPPGVDPDDAADAAIEQHDRDGDGALSQAEWSASPELAAVAEHYDTTSDRALSAEEIAEGIRIWKEGPVGARAV